MKTNKSSSTSYRSPLHTDLGGHFEEMACFIGQKINTSHRHRRAWNESMLENFLYSTGVTAYVVIRSNRQPKSLGRKCEHFATKPTSHSKSVYLRTPVLCTPVEALQALAKEAHIDYDHFVRTSEPDHRFAVQHFWVRTIAMDRLALIS